MNQKQVKTNFIDFFSPILKLTYKKKLINISKEKNNGWNNVMAFL